MNFWTNPEQFPVLIPTKHITSSAKIIRLNLQDVILLQPKHTYLSKTVKINPIIMMHILVVSSSFPADFRFSHTYPTTHWLFRFLYIGSYRLDGWCWWRQSLPHVEWRRLGSLLRTLPGLFPALMMPFNHTHKSSSLAALSFSLRHNAVPARFRRGGSISTRSAGRRRFPS